MRQVGGGVHGHGARGRRRCPQPWVATGFVPGRTLRDHVGARGPLEGDILTAFAAGTAESLVAVHAAGVVRCDREPGGVILARAPGHRPHGQLAGRASTTPGRAVGSQTEPDSGGRAAMAVQVQIADGIDIPAVGEGRPWVVCAVIVDAQGRAFTQRRAPHRRIFPDTWDIVGGHVEPGETVVEALAREIFEETGWRLTAILADLGSLTWTPADGIERFEVDYLVRVDGDLDAPALERDKHPEYAWVDETQLERLADDNEPDHTFVADIIALGLERAREIRSR